MRAIEGRVGGQAKSQGPYREYRIDSVTHAMSNVDHEHKEIHDGSHYFVDDVFDLAINEVYDYQLTTPNTTKWAHFVFSIETEKETEWIIYEGVTIATPGTAVVPRNNNRNYADASVITLKGILNTSVANANSDTAVAGATILRHGISGAGQNNGGRDRNMREIVLKQNTNYCFRAIATVAGYVDFEMSWYEHTSRS